MADCERALGRPERALVLLDDADVPKLAQATRVELVIVVAGARRDLGQPEAAVLLLQGPARATTVRRPWAARLWYAYADALLAADREPESREWFAKAAEHDGQGETDAMERLLELDGLVIDDLLDEDDEPGPQGLEAEEPVDLQALLTAPIEGTAPSDSPRGGHTAAAAATADAEPRADPASSTARVDETSGGGARRPASDGSRTSQEPGPGPETTPTDRVPGPPPAPGAGPLFSHHGLDSEEPTRAGLSVPAVTFATPPVQEDAEDDAP